MSRWSECYDVERDALVLHVHVQPRAGRAAFGAGAAAFPGAAFVGAAVFVGAAFAGPAFAGAVFTGVALAAAAAVFAVGTPAFLTGLAPRGATARPAGFAGAAFDVFVTFAAGDALLVAAVAGALAAGRLAVAADAAAARFFFGSAFAIDTFRGNSGPGGGRL